jgi:hypothetical protein
MDAALPGTTVLDGDQLVAARLRALTGRDELLAREHPDRLDGHAGAGELLAACVEELRFASGRAQRATAGVVERLTAGDREALLLRLRQASFGDRLNVVVSCPDPRCGAPMDLELRVSELCCAPAETAAEWHECGSVRFRLPAGGDLVAVAQIAMDDPAAAATALARRCTAAGGGLDDARLVALLDGAIAELDPQAEVQLALTCPECDGEFTSRLDAARLLRDELAARRADFELGIHLLALHYHWTEDAILALPSARRRRYVTTLVDSLEGAEPLV